MVQVKAKHFNLIIPQVFNILYDYP